MALSPGNLPELYAYLKAALSSDTTTRQNAEARLKNIETYDNFSSCLAEIFSSKEADHSVRWLTIVHFKNSMSRNWKARTSQKAISESEKQHLRQKLLMLISQEDNQFAVQIAVVIAKIARVDYPRHWPSLFTDLLGKLDTSDTLTTRRTYLVLHHVLKELSSKRLAPDQRAFAEVTQKLFEPLWTQWKNDTHTLFSSLQAALQAASPPQTILVTMERWLMILKALRRMLLFGFGSDAKSIQSLDAISQVMPDMLQVLQGLMQLQPQQSSQRTQLHAMLDRALVKLAKTLVGTQETHPWSTLRCSAFEGLLSFCHQQTCQAPANRSAAVDRLYALLMLMLHNTMKSPAYKGTSGYLGELAVDDGKRQTAKGLAEEARRRLASFWSAERQQQLFHALLEHFLPLTARDLSEWSDEASRFHAQADVGSWQEHPRSVAEALFRILLQEHRQSLAPYIIQTLQATMSRCPAGSAQRLPGPSINGIPASVLFKEAVYNAMAVGAYELHDYVELSSWLRSSLLLELADASDQAKPLRRRALLLLGQWVTKLTADDRQLVYQAATQLLVDADAAVQLAAVDCLHALVDDWEFQEEAFLPYVHACFQRLAGILNGSEEFDTQLAIFNFINVLVDRLGDEIKPLAPGLLQLIPGLWTTSEGQSLLRIQVLLALQRLVNALGSDSTRCYDLLLPILRHCTDINQPDELNLLEDGLQLWLIALRNAPTAQEPLLALFPNLAAVMERSPEHVQVALPIITSCVLMGGAAFLDQHGVAISHLFEGLIGNVKERAMLLLISAIELLIRAQPDVACRVLQPTLAKLLACLLYGQETGLVIASGMAIFARMIIHNVQSLLQLLVAAAAPLSAQGLLSSPAMPNGTPLNGTHISHSSADSVHQHSIPGEQVLFLKLLDTWLDRFDSIGSSPARKQSALALCSLLPVPIPAILERLPDAIADITAVCFEVEEDGSLSHLEQEYYHQAPLGNEGIDPGSAAAASEEAEGECVRRQAVFQRDAISSMKLGDVLGQKLRECACCHGEGLQASLAALDTTIALQLQKVLAKDHKSSRAAPG
ncbi:hypothetical protein WJX74_006339 [Apatococcus lobatus]|uniref:Importin N-terminal domain-containing protein n=1 Tax=Apatococcus lobatus TaxID=904363 RepID=A0AAW1QN69_9CHLO